MRNHLLRFVNARIEASRTDPAALTARTLNWGPITFGFIVAVVEFWFAQSRELYLRLASDGEPAQALLGLFSVLLLATVLHAWNSKLLSARIDLLYPEHAHPETDLRLKQVRNLNGLLCASLPCIGLVLGLFWVWNDIGVARQHIAWSDSVMTEHLEQVSERIVAFIGCVMLASLALLLALRRHAGTASLSVTWAIGLGILFSPLLPSETQIFIARQLGPLCMFALVAIGLVALVRLLHKLVRLLIEKAAVYLIFVLTHWMGGSALFVGLAGATTALLTAALLLGSLRPSPAEYIPTQSRSTIATTVTELLERRERPAAPNGAPPPAIARQEPALPTFRHQFERWLDARGLRKDQLPSVQRPYPIFVVASQGGGIYAASLAMTFLAAMQDQCPAFARHVFAISAVSGGAIGSSVFQSLVEDVGGQGCAIAPSTDGTLSAIASGVATDDHLSALLLSTPLDWLAKFIPGDSTYRADALRESFLSSYRRRASSRAADLAKPFAAHWDPALASRKPALLLNATSVETGERIAFAPFSLVGIGDATLTSFRDVEAALAMEESDAVRLVSQTVIDAAVTSARFPGVLPAWPLRHLGLVSEPGETRQINFVDGGYADSSGAATASDVLTELRSSLAAMNLSAHFSLHLILLTDTTTTIDLARARGSIFVDTKVPVEALFNVRQLLARRAVVQAVADLERRQIEVISLQLDHRIFPLPLGWTLSRTSNLFIQRMIANPISCYEPGPDPNNPEARPRQLTSFEDVVRRNACARGRIIELLNGN